MLGRVSTAWLVHNGKSTVTGGALYNGDVPLTWETFFPLWHFGTIIGRKCAYFGRTLAIFVCIDGLQIAQVCRNSGTFYYFFYYAYFIHIKTTNKTQQTSRIWSGILVPIWKSPAEVAEHSYSIPGWISPPPHPPPPPHTHTLESSMIPSPLSWFSARNTLHIVLYCIVHSKNWNVHLTFKRAEEWPLFPHAISNILSSWIQHL